MFLLVTNVYRKSKEGSSQGNNTHGGKLLRPVCSYTCTVCVDNKDSVTCSVAHRLDLRKHDGDAEENVN